MINLSLLALVILTILLVVWDWRRGSNPPTPPEQLTHDRDPTDDDWYNS